jgi:hypothetical protein
LFGQNPIIFVFLEQTLSVQKLFVKSCRNKFVRTNVDRTNIDMTKVVRTKVVKSKVVKKILWEKVFITNIVNEKLFRLNVRVNTERAKVGRKKLL